MDDLEWDYWMGTEVRQQSGYGFQERFLAWMGRVKMTRWGQGVRTDLSWGRERVLFIGVVLALQSAALSEDVLRELSRSGLDKPELLS